MSSVAADLTLENTFARDLDGLFVPWQAAQFPEPALLALNEELARELGLDPATLATPAGIALLIGADLPAGAAPIAQGYAGHQFGGYSPRLGDGRALLLGELTDAAGRRRDLHLKGSGGTPFSRGGDGKAAVGPMLREYVIGEAMHALGVPTTRALAVLGTSEQIAREEGLLPGAVLVRVAASHLRVGSFQYAAAMTAAKKDPTILRRLADYAIARHHPAAAEADQPYVALLEAVTQRQAELVARWMCLGFVHGVMNTDNVTISGETIDYGPCAFMEGYDPGTVFSSIDHAGRYAYANQPPITLWNLSRFAESLLPLVNEDVDEDQEAAVAKVVPVLDTFADHFAAAWRAGMLAKVGLADTGDNVELLQELLALMQTARVDWTSFWRALAQDARGGTVARDMFLAREDFDAWATRWLDRKPDAEAMDAVNPVYIPRNHKVQEALDAATTGDLGPVTRLIEVIREPYVVRPGLEAYAEPDPNGGGYVTFCGT
ncbi:YdiU family protein [Sporichthya sp.]|uniref:protein adenylyltransferase SelO n=1 Tax=Sporichthya sp. TaxID=65475 RepID=UPI001854421E|nr:YdiU family protein [Sporichthya sp.]MBA3741797.1 YdiU family protein [Sporichthya sp.]